MKKNIKIESDDPIKKRFNLVVKGLVEKIVTVLPQTIRMQGRPGETLEKIVSITPSPKYPFSILDIKIKNKTPIQTTLIKPESNNKPWQISVKVTSDEVQSFYDVLKIRTDSKLKPNLTVRVFAAFVAPKRLNAEK